MSLQALFEQIKKGDVAVHSELGSRDENKQRRQFIERYAKQKLKLGINDRILLFKDIVFPYNFTGVSDDNYNKKTPFRPILLPSQTIAMIKKLCSEDEQAKANWRDILGGDFDYSTEEATLKEYYMFKKAGFVKPRIMTYYTVSVNVPEEFGGSKFKQKYTIDGSQLNESGSYDVDNAPEHYLGALYFNSVAREEWQIQKTALEAKSATKEQLTSQRRTVYSKVPISFPQITNLITFFAVPLNEFPKVSEDKFMEIENYVRFFSYTEKWSTAIEKVYSKDKLDDEIDFFDLTMTTPAEGAVMTDGKVYTDKDVAELYQALTINVTDGRESINADDETREAYARFHEVAKKYFEYSQAESFKEDGDTFEKIMAASNRFRPITKIKDKLLPMLGKVYQATFKDSKYNTDKIKAANSIFLSMIDKSTAKELAGYDDDEIEQAQLEQAQSISDIVNDSREDDDDTNIDLTGDDSSVPVNLDIME